MNWGVVMDKKKTIFDYMNAIYHKKDIKYIKKECSGYLLSLWMSHDKKLCKMVNDINKFIFLLPDEMIYKYFFHAVPKGRRYLKWTKKDKIEKKKDGIIKKLSIKYNCSTDEIKKSLI